MDTLDIQYRFRLKGNIQEIFDYSLNPETTELIDNIPDNLPKWALLDNHKCPICPLKSCQHEYCPLAANLVSVIKRFDHILSFDEIHLDVITKDRSVFQQTSAQKGISSMIGLITAACGCPHTSFFKPMANFHLPLSNETETFYRATSMYMLAQFFCYDDNRDIDLKFKGLKIIYENMRTINAHLVQRLRSQTTADSSINAIVRLDMFALSIPFVIEESLEDIKNLFNPYLAKYPNS